MFPLNELFSVPFLLLQVSCTDWRSSGPSWNTLRSRTSPSTRSCRNTSPSSRTWRTSGWWWVSKKNDRHVSPTRGENDRLWPLTFVSAAPNGRGGRQEETSLVLGRGWREASATSFQLYLKTHAGLQILHRCSSSSCCCCTERHTQRKHPENIRRLLPGEEAHRAWSGEEGKCCTK